MIQRSDPIYSHPLISERAIDETRPLKVAYIGAGMSGIIAGVLLPKLVPNINLTIYEKNADVGGTWYENRYPGCACDIPAHAYQLSFEPNVAWSKFYVGAQEIFRYWQRIADKYNVRRLIKFHHKCVEARWDNSITKWRVKIENLTTGDVFEDISDVIITGSGILNDWKYPDIKGLHDFKGRLLHTATWDPSYDPTDDTVAVIGNGSSGIQLVPALQKQVQHLDHYIRHPTWISTTFGHDLVRQRNAGEDGNFEYTESEISTWQTNPKAYQEYRKSVERAMQKGYIATHRDTTALHGATNFFKSTMQQRLTTAHAPSSLTTQLIPTFPPFCRRLTPGINYLESLTQRNVHPITTPISHITSTGITTTDGTHRPVSTIICATGFNTSFLNRIPIFGRSPSTSLSTRYSATRQESYLGITLNDFPNFMQCLGPNSGHVVGNFVTYIERIHEYIAALLNRLSRSNVASIEPRAEAVRTFTDFAEAFFERTVFSEDCGSWYKSEKTPGGEGATGRVTALWPGSCAHAMQALSEVRWEDFVVEDKDGKAAGWLGNGFAVCETEEDDEALVGYLDGKWNRLNGHDKEHGVLV